METRNAIIEILEDLCPGADCDTCTALVDEHHLDSLTMIALVAELEDSFDIEVPPVAIVADNFNSVDAIAKLVDTLVEDAE